MNTPSSHPGWRRIVSTISAAIAVSLLLSLASAFMCNRDKNRFQTIDQQTAILHGQPVPFGDQSYFFPAWQNRVLFPAVLGLVSKLPLSLALEHRYVLLRVAEAMAACVFFALLLLRAGTSPRDTLNGLLVLGICLIGTFTNPWENPTDFLDVIFFCLFITLAERRLRWAFLGAAILASANRESAAFAGFIWFFLLAWRPKGRGTSVRESLFAALATISAVVSVILLRISFGGVSSSSGNLVVSPRQAISRTLSFFASPSPYGWVVVLLAIATVLSAAILLRPAPLGECGRQLVIAAIVISMVTAFLGSADELRIFIPAFVIITFAAFAERDALAELQARS